MGIHLTTKVSTIEQREVTKSPQMKPKLALLVNIVAPYRVPIYERIGSVLETHVLYSGSEDNRASWADGHSNLTSVRVKRSWGITLHSSRQSSTGTFDERYLHITPGYFVDLFRIRPDAIISNEMGFRTLVALIYGTALRKPVWVWWGGTLHTERSRGAAKSILRKLISRWAKRWISYGQSSTEYLLSLGVSREAILEIQNCVDERLYTHPTRPSLDLQPKPVFLYVGQLLGRKGVDRLLHAAGRLQAQGHHFSLLVVGNGPERHALEATRKQLELADVHFHPAQPPGNMPGIYRSADFLVFPTQEDVWGLVVNEALWSGIPVLASLYAGCARELLPEQNLFDPLDEDDFVAALRRALDGEIAPADHSKLIACHEVADMLVREIRGAVKQ